MPAPRKSHPAQTCYNGAMKNASEILRHLFHPSQKEKLVRHRCYRRFLASLPPKWQQAVAFVYIKDATLFLALRHPGYKMEFEYNSNRDLMKSLLTLFAKTHPECKLPEVRRIVAFASKFHTPLPKRTDTIPYYTEKAKGTFRIQTDDAILRDKFESVKERIRCLKP